VYGKVQGKKFERVNMAAAKCEDDVIGRYEYTCNMNSALFELWFTEVLLKLLPSGSVIILDNASWHRKKVLTALAEYSPDFNPIEQV